MKRWLALAMLAGIAAGCSAGHERAATGTLSEARRDSVLARSSLPGANAVGAALNASGEEAARAARMNAQVDSLPR